MRLLHCQPSTDSPALPFSSNVDEKPLPLQLVLTAAQHGIHLTVALAGYFRNEAQGNPRARI
jgi:hypothetical protein